MGVPMIQLVMILARQMSRPLSDAVMRYGRNHPAFRNKVLIPIGRKMAHLATRIQMRKMGMGRPATLPEVSETAALEQASDVVQQAVIFTYSAGLFLAYYALTNPNRDAAKEDDAKEDEAKPMTKKDLNKLKKELEKDLDELKNEKEELKKKYEELRARVEKMEEMNSREEAKLKLPTSKGGKYSKPFPRVSSLPLDDAAHIVAPGAQKSTP
uniref:RIC3 domain-containing protein n=1 Tax=Steinernema glaseri TaxID=37863 RepID=A0A1I7ZSH7_9BILA